jgi:hypothetical protein
MTMGYMDFLEISAVVAHATVVKSYHPDATSEELMDHVASNFPDLSNDEMDVVEQRICDLWFGGVVPLPYEPSMGGSPMNIQEREVVFDLGLVCPQCGSEQVDIHHHNGTFSVPECDYKQCDDCGHQWGHE